jgi:hypothetical protein
MSTPISQLPPHSQPVANDPVLVQQIIKESIGVQNEKTPQTQIQQRPQISFPNSSMSGYIPPSYRPQHKDIDYMHLLKGIILVSALVFISQMPSLREYVSLYIPQNDLNLIVRALLAGVSYVGLDMVF